jgi:spermidine synthase
MVDAALSLTFECTGGQTLWQQHSQAGHLQVAQNAHYRWLEFGNGVAQSAFARNNPHALALPYTRWLLAGLMFTTAVERATLLGLGGGSLASYLARAGINVTAVDADPLVVAAAQQFFPLPEQNLDIEVCDAREYLAQPGAHGMDLLLVDLFTCEGMPSWLAHASFHDACASALAPGGVVCLNLAVDCAEALDELLEALRKAYGNQALAIAVPQHANIIAMAVNGPQPDSWDTLQPRAQALERRLGLPFERMLAAIFYAHGSRHRLRFGASAASLGLSY